MQGSNTADREWSRANELRQVLTDFGYTADQIAGADQVEWELAASVAGHTEVPGRNVRRTVLVQVRDRERAPDPFAGMPRE